LAWGLIAVALCRDLDGVINDSYGEIRANTAGGIILASGVLTMVLYLWLRGWRPLQQFRWGSLVAAFNEVPTYGDVILLLQPISIGVAFISQEESNPAAVAIPFFVYIGFIVYY